MAYRSISTTTAENTSCTGSAPAGTQSTDVLVAVLITRLSRSSPVNPSGWTMLTPGGTGLISTSQCSYWTAPGSVSDFVWSQSNSTAMVLHIVAFSGRGGTVTGNAQFDNLASAVFTAPAITAASGDDLMLAFSQIDIDSVFGTTPSGGTTRADTYLGGVVQLIATTDSLSAGSTGPYTLQGLSSFKDGQGVSILLPAAGGSTATTAWLRA